MSENERGFYIGLTRFEPEQEIPAWQALDEVCRKWAVLSLHEKDLKNYEISAGIYQ